VLHILVTLEYPADNNNNCPQCNANSNQLTRFPIAPKESFTFNYKCFPKCIIADYIVIFRKHRHRSEILKFLEKILANHERIMESI
jgi:hypothetical protein